MEKIMEKEKIKELIEYAETLYSNNLPDDEIIKAMIRQGADQELAKEILKTADKRERKEKASKGKYAIISGIGLLLVGFYLHIILMVIGLLVIVGGVADYLISKSKRK